MAKVPLDTEQEVREFLALCLDPGRGPRFQRTPGKLAEVMPLWLFDRMAEHAPHLAALCKMADRMEVRAAQARKAYVDALATWIANPPAEGAEDTDADADVWEVPHGAHVSEHWLWECRKKTGGCGYRTPFYSSSREAAQDLLGQHRDGCATDHLPQEHP